MERRKSELVMIDNSKLIKEVLSKNSTIPSAPITRYTSGIIHDSYDLGKYVLKIEGNEDYAKGVLEYQPEILNKLFSIGAKVPQVIDAGAIENKPYLLMEKLRGTNIVYGWRDFNMRQKERFMSELAEELKKYHSIKSSFYATPICSGSSFSHFDEALKRITEFDKIKIEEVPTEYRYDIEFLKKFCRDNIEILHEEGTAVLVHNDIHLENIFSDGEHITGIIDFDWASYAPRDYELQHIVQTFRYPLYTVEERLEPLYENYQMIEEFGFLKKYYPELFQYENLATRIRVYYLTKVIDRIVDFQEGTWRGKDNKAFHIFSEEMRDIYKTDWLDNLLII